MNYQETKQRIHKLKHSFKPSIKSFTVPIAFFRKMFEPYFYTKPQELIDLEEWRKENPIFKDNVFELPKNYQKPSLYHPAYLGKKGAIEADIKNVSLNDDGNGYSYHAKDDAPQIPVKDINPSHDNKFNIFDNIGDYINNTDKLPVNSIIFAQNDNTFEALMFTGAGRRYHFSRENGKEEEKRPRQLRANARNKSRIKAIDPHIKKNRNGHDDWQWAHFFPVGYYGSEGDERLGVRWWGEDNIGAQKQFEDRQDKHKDGFYWLTRIEKVDGEVTEAGMFSGGSDIQHSGLRWIAKTYSKDGELLDEMKVEHFVDYRVEEENIWNPECENAWTWNFGIDQDVVSASSTEEDEEEDGVDDNDIYSDYYYSTERLYFESKEADLVVSFGNDSNGNPVKVDLASPEACHVIFCGTTGSGKSVELVSIISQLMIHNTPQQVQFVGIDPKMTEFAVYKDSPYFAVNPILDTNEASMLSRFALMVSETRSAMFAEIGVKNLTEYNEWVENNKAEAEEKKFGYLPHLFLLTDEFASLMAQNRQENEDTFNRIAAECRAQGVHALLATQRPSVDVITGTMKNNFPAKCGLSMGSSVDSSTLMEVEENDINPHQLKGRGDNILKTQNRRVRSQGYFFSQRDVTHINDFNKVNYFGVIREDDKIVPDISKSKMVKYKRELVRAGLAEQNGNTYTLIKKKKKEVA